MQAAIQGRPSTFSTSSLEEARDKLTRQYCPHTITRCERTSGLRVRYSQAEYGDLSLNYLQYGAQVEIRPREFETFYMVLIPLAGRAAIQIGEHSYIVGPGTGAII